MTSKTARWNLIATVVVVLFIVWWIDPAGRAPQWARFWARQHPAVVHLPIGFLLFGAILALFRRWQKSESPSSTEQAALVLGGWGAVLAAAAGSWLIQMGAFPADALQWHRIIGFLIPILAAATVWLGILRQQSGARTAVWGLLIGSLMIGGHLGGEMSHGKAYVTEYAPSLLKPVVGEAPTLATRFDVSAPDSTTVYEAFAAPIMQAYCTSCHGEGRTKGGLDLTTADAIATHQTDTEDDPLITWGDASASLLIQRIKLPAEHGRAMPPQPDARPMTHADVELLAWWVNSESGFDQTIADAPRTPAIELLLQAYGLEEQESGVFALNPPPADSASIDVVRQLGARITQVASDRWFLEWASPSTESLHDDAALDLAGQVISMDLSGGSASDDDLARIASFSLLTSLDLSETSVTGASLDALASLEFLTRLNLFGTRVDDAALEHLASFPSLESVYLWNTDVSEEGVAQLRNALPNATINVGE